MELPGGIVVGDGTVARQVGIRPVTGKLELALFGAGSDAAADRAARIDGIIAAAVDLPLPDPAPGALFIGDRHFLLVQIARALGHQQFWITGICASCDAPFDACVELAEFPVKPSARGCSTASVDLPSGAVRVRAPTGADQAAIAGYDDRRTAIEALARRLIEPASGDVPVLDDDTLEAIDSAARSVSPEASQSLATTCPDCGAANEIPFDIAALLVSTLANPLDDVHDIASTYHWSEADILDLPRARRQAYLDRIGRDQDMMR